MYLSLPEHLAGLGVSTHDVGVLHLSDRVEIPGTDRLQIAIYDITIVHNTPST